MATTRAGQLQCRANWKAFSGDTENGYLYWDTDGEEIRFTEYSGLRNHEYYKSYVDDVSRNYYDINLILQGFDEQPREDCNLSKHTPEGLETEKPYIKNDEIYCIQFKPIENNKYPQNFSIVLHNSKNNDYLSIRSFKIPAKTAAKEYEVFFCPQSFGSTNDYDEILFQVNREDSNEINVIMELHSFKLSKLNNLMDKMLDDVTGEPIEELLGLHFETVNRGECLFFINFDTFWIGNDKVLNIDEELGLTITKLAYIDYIPRNDKTYNTDDYITCLVNYKY